MGDFHNIVFYAGKSVGQDEHELHGIGRCQ